MDLAVADDHAVCYSADRDSDVGPGAGAVSDPQCGDADTGTRLVAADRPQHCRFRRGAGV